MYAVVHSCLTPAERLAEEIEEGAVRKESTRKQRTFSSSVWNLGLPRD